MKKLLAVLLTALMLLSIASTAAFAENEPPQPEQGQEEFQGEQEEPVIEFVWLDDEGREAPDPDDPENIKVRSVYDGNVHNNDVHGAQYNDFTNTLTLTDFDGRQIALRIRAMGDLKIELSGDNELAVIYVIAQGNSSVDFIGSGTLKLNENKFFDYAMYAEARGSEFHTNFGKNVSAKLWGRDGAVMITAAADMDSKSVLNIEEGERVSLERHVDENAVQEGARVEAEVIKIERREDSRRVTPLDNEDDLVGIYVGEHRFIRDEESNEEYEGWTVRKLVYSEQFDFYFTDVSFGERGEMNFSNEQFEHSHFTVRTELVPDRPEQISMMGWLNYFDAHLATDNKGKQYAIIGDDACEMQPIPELEGKYFFTKVEGLTRFMLNESNTEVHGYMLDHANEENVLGNKLKSKSDTYGIYVGGEFRDEQGNTAMYVENLLYDDHLEVYFPDNSFNNGSNRKEMSREEFDEGYEFVNTYVERPAEIELFGSEWRDRRPLSKDEQGRLYAVDEFDDEQGSHVREVYSLTAVDALSGGGNTVYYMTRVEDTDNFELTDVREEVQQVSELYEYKLTDKEFEVVGQKSEVEQTPIPLIDVGNITTELPTRLYVLFTGEVNPNSDCPEQMRVYDEIWTNTKDGSTCSLRNRTDTLPEVKAGDVYTYSMVLKANNGYIFKDGFEFICGGDHRELNYVISDDGKTITISHFEDDALAGDIAGFKVSGIKNLVYTGKSLTQKLTVKDGGTTLKSGTDYTVTYKNNKNVGTATLTIKGKGDFAGTIKKTFKIAKANNPMTVKAASKTVKYSALKKKAQAVKPLTISKAQGAKSFAKVSGNSKIKVNKSTGAVTVAKGLKKGNYTVCIKVTAKGNSNYKSGTKTVKFRIIVK